MAPANPHPDFRRNMIRLWLLAVAALVFFMVLVGGATRLTESGLSIVEWKPVAGALPPLTEGEWQAEFEKYKAIPQYQKLNPGMGIAEFKTIYWWEWTHRMLGRVIGAAFLLPFLWFLWRGWIDKGLQWRLAAIFALGAFQGAVGWWMVASGLADRVSVSPYRLAFHLTLACLLYVALIWTAQRVKPRRAADAPELASSALGLLVLVLVQIYLGALVAGLDAGLAYNTWPLIDGALVPDPLRLLLLTPAWRNFFENVLTVQFDHRMVAYALWLAAVLHTVNAWRTQNKGPTRDGALLLAVAVTIQASLGILTLLYQAPLGLALAHQAMAMLVLTAAAVHAERVTVPRQSV